MRSPLIALLLIGTAMPITLAQEAAKVDVQQITFLQASAAEIIPQEGGVAILARDLEATKKYAAKILITDQPNDYIEASRLLNVDGVTVTEFPPRVIQPLTQADGVNAYLLTGNPGDRFGVSVRSSVIPQWLEVKIDGPSSPDPDRPDEPTDPNDPNDPEPEPDDPEPPAGDLTPADLAKIESTVTASVQALQDPITQAEIKKELETLLANFPETREAAVVGTKNAIAMGLVKSAPKLKPPYKDWKGKFRTPLDDAISEIETKADTAEEFKQIVQAIVRGLGTAVQASVQAADAPPSTKQVKKMFYRPVTKQVPRYCSAGKICGWDTVTVQEAYWGWVTVDD